MKQRIWTQALAAGVAAWTWGVGPAVAQPEIVSQEGGYLTWTNIRPDRYYTIQYRPDLDGEPGAEDWHEPTAMQNLRSDEDTLTVPIGRFFRVVERTTPVGMEPRYVDHDDGTVTDQATGLMWVQAPHELPGNSEMMAWQEAVDFCNALVFAGRADWRLPHVNRRDGADGPLRPAELNTLGRFCGDPDRAWQGWPGAPFIGNHAWYYWTATTSESNPNAAWGLYLNSIHTVLKSNLRYVWPVRGP